MASPAINDSIVVTLVYPDLLATGPLLRMKDSPASLCSALLTRSIRSQSPRARQAGVWRRCDSLTPQVVSFLRHGALELEALGDLPFVEIREGLCCISSHSQLWWIHIIFKVARAQQVLQRWIGSYKEALMVRHGSVLMSRRNSRRVAQ